MGLNRLTEKDIILDMKLKGTKKKRENIYSLLPSVETLFIDGDIPSLKDIDYGKIVHVDIETSGLDPKRDSLWVVNVGYAPLKDGTFTKAVVCRVADEVSCPTNLRQLLTGNISKIVHNAIFDSAWLYTKWKVQTEPILCTKILARMTRKFGNSYGNLVKVASELEVPKSKSLTMSPWNEKFEDWSPQMKNYCSYDVVFGLKIFNYLKDITSKDQFERFSNICKSWMYVYKLLDYMDYRDLRVI